MYEMTMEAAIIAANRLLTEERMDIDREEMKAAIRKLIDAAQFRIKKEPNLKRYKASFGGYKIRRDLFCPNCYHTLGMDDFCRCCGQALDRSNI